MPEGVFGIRYRNRRDAGRRLATLVRAALGPADEAVVVALPRGGVPVAFEIALALELALDVFVARKLGVPGCEEAAMGAIAGDGSYVLNDEIVQALSISTAAIGDAIARERREIERRERRYRAGHPPAPLAGKTIVLVDDGLATGATMLVAARALERERPARIVAAVPVGTADACERLRSRATVVCPHTPPGFRGVGTWYADFRQVGDDEVRDLLQRASLRRPT